MLGFFETYVWCNRTIVGKMKSKAKQSTFAMACTRDSISLFSSSSFVCTFGHIDILLFQLSILHKGISFGTKTTSKNKIRPLQNSQLIQSNTENESGKKKSAHPKHNQIWRSDTLGELKVDTNKLDSGCFFLLNNNFLKWTVCRLLLQQHTSAHNRETERKEKKVMPLTNASEN